MTAQLLHLENRSVIRLKGPEAISFLQGLVTNDVEAAGVDGAVYAGILTPQGKFLFDMIIVSDGADLLLDIEADRKTDLLRRLMMYKLRADVETIDEDTKVWALFNGEAQSGLSYDDPRHKALHKRVIAQDNPAPDAEPLSLDIYEERRIRHGVPDGSRDMKIEKYFWLETNAEKLNGVSFTKGCYVGQELTARMKHRTTLKKMITTVTFEGEVTEGDTISTEEGKNAGEILTSVNGYALAYMRLEHTDKPLKTDKATIRVNL